MMSRPKGKISRFEDLDVWKNAKAVVIKVYKVSGIGDFARDFELRDQMRRAAVFIMSNIAEGFERQSDKEFSGFLYMAKGSAGELRSQLYIAQELGYLSLKGKQSLQQDLEVISKQLSGLIRHLNS